MSLSYKFNELRQAEVEQFFEQLFGVGLKDYRYLPNAPASGRGRLMQATIEVENLDTLLVAIDGAGKKREWNTLHGDIVIE